MSPRTGGTDPAPAKKYPLRLQMPVDDPDVDAFLAAQGVRFQSQAIVMLIRMWVNEFGPTNVLEQTMGAVTVSGLKRGLVSNPASDEPETTERATAPTSAARPQSAPAPAPAPAPEPESVATPEPAQAPTPPPTPAATTKPAASPPSDDFEDLFRQ